MTLDEFMDMGLWQLRKTGEPSRRNVSYPGFLFLFLRLRASPDGSAVLEIANVTVHLEDRGRGVFTKTLRHIKYKYPEVHIRVERVTDQRFQLYLMKLGFETTGQQVYCLDRDKDMP